MRKSILLLFLTLLEINISADNVREKINFNESWYFNLDDNTDYSAENYNHKDWRELDLPHDWSIEGSYDKTNPMGATCGYLPAGIAYYRKTVAVSDDWKGKYVEIAFDGVFMNSTVWANGQELGTRPYGWVSFAYDISDIVASSDSITFAVRVDNDLQPSARWYTGSGIYADTWIKVCDPIHIAQEGGVFVHTSGNEVTVETEIENLSSSSASLVLKTIILDADDVAVDSVSSAVDVETSESGSLIQKITLEDPKLWSLEEPYLYTLVSEVWQGEELLDEVETTFGVRDIEWVAETGFWINGENVKLQGVCNHQDAGPLGAAVPDKILRYRIQQLKDMGVNAIRTSHNPQTPKFYEYCDEIGMLVMDEIFDGWKGKAAHDYGEYYFADWWDTDLTSWVKRDRNHPSVIIWSLGNETSNTSGGSEAEDLVSLCHNLDPTRLVTSGHSGTSYMDVIGYNGSSERVDYIADLEGNTKPIVGTENTHTWQVRGYYRTQTWYRDGEQDYVYTTDDLTDEEIFYNDFMSSYDRTSAKKVFNSSYDNAYVRLNSRGHVEQIRDYDYYSGAFRWTGYDYIGEASYVHGGWPFKAFMGGAIDLSNFEKDLYYLYQSQWTEEPMLHVFPHWTHPMMELGTEVPIWVYSNCDEIELFFDGESLGTKTPGTTRFDMQCEWLVPWNPGTLKAVAYIDGSVVLEKEIKTAGRPAQNALSIDGEPLADSGKDIVQIRVTAQDSVGTMYPYGENRTYFHVIGPASIKALGNGSPIDVEPHYGVNNRIAFYGLTRAFIEATGEDGDINLLTAAILGEKKQVTSAMVSIDTTMINLRGADAQPTIKIYYTTDGSEPTSSSSVYTESFAVELGTTVKAAVELDGEIVLQMSERFAEDEGFVWNDPDYVPEPLDPNSLEAEDAAFEGATIKTSGSGFSGTGFLNFGQSLQGYVQWYQENDGDEYETMLNIHYSCQSGSDGRVIDVIVNDEEIATDFLLPNTGSWGNDWGTMSIQITLERGANTIRLQNPASGGPYIDKISFSELSAIDDLSALDAVSVSSPVKDVLNIYGLSSPDWLVFSMMGVELKSGTGTDVDVADLKESAYLIKITDQYGNSTVKQFVKY